jgi:hypothetical protein
MRGYSRADLPYEQPTKTEPNGKFGPCWQDNIIINHCRYEPCHACKERRHNGPTPISTGGRAMPCFIPQPLGSVLCAGANTLRAPPR